MRLNYAIVFVSDMSRSVAFYRDLLGIPLKFETEQWTEFATDGATLALHASEPEMNEPAEVRSKSPGQCHPGLSVDHLDSLHSKLMDQGVTCVQEPRETFGSRIAQYADPDGLVISVSEIKG